jgi:hypothetical protein
VDYSAGDATRLLADHVPDHKTVSLEQHIQSNWDKTDKQGVKEGIIAADIPGYKQSILTCTSSLTFAPTTHARALGRKITIIVFPTGKSRLLWKLAAV